MADKDHPALIYGAWHNPSPLPEGTVIKGSIMIDGQMKLQYSRLAPSSEASWSDGCIGLHVTPGSLTKKGNPK